MATESAAFLTTSYLASLPDYNLGTAAVSPSRRSITGPKGIAFVEPRVMQVLTLLAEAKGDVVTREELFRRCWGSPNVGDDSLNRAITGIRRLASKVGEEGFSVENIPRTGYRLRETVTADVPVEKQYGGSLLSRRTVVLGGGTAAALIGAGGYWTSQETSAARITELMEESRAAMRSGIPSEEQRALGLMERAVGASPRNAEAWGLLALTRARIDEHGGPSTASSYAVKVEKEAGRALRLDPGNANARSALAAAIPYYGDWLKAEQRFDAVLRDHPRHLYTLDSRSFFLGAVGRMRESALHRMTFAGEEPFDVNLQLRQIYCLWFLDRIEEADRVAGRAIQMWPYHIGVWMARLWVLCGTGRAERALAHIDDEARPNLPQPVLSTLRASIRASISRDPTALAAASAQVMGTVRRSVQAVVNAMMLLNLMGRIDDAFKLAEAYYLERGPLLAATNSRPGEIVVTDQRRRKTNMLFTPIARDMQRDPRFLPLMRGIGLTDYWERRGVVSDFMKLGAT